jgi:hypothetical protein
MADSGSVSTIDNTARTAVALPGGTALIAPDPPPAAPDLAIVILNYNTRDLLWACLDSLRRRSLRHDVHICVVETAAPPW